MDCTLSLHSTRFPIITWCRCINGLYHEPCSHNLNLSTVCFALLADGNIPDSPCLICLTSTYSRAPTSICYCTLLNFPCLQFPYSFVLFASSCFRVCVPLLPGPSPSLNLCSHASPVMRHFYPSVCVRSICPHASSTKYRQLHNSSVLHPP